MTKNVGSFDRFLRLLGATGLVLAAFLAPLPGPARLALGASGVYLMATVLFGWCVGYRLLGRSTCAFPPANGT